jgi:aldose 1-epimerase
MLTLQAGESSLVLAPEIGGAIVGWSFGTIPLLRRPHPNAIVQRNVHGLGCFPLIPFSNRIANGQFRWDGSNHAMPRNLGDHPHTIHGVGWQSTWQLASVSTTSAVLTLHHDAIGPQASRWPFAFTAEQHFALSPTALRIELMLTNQHTHDAPAGLGLHPYFPRAGTSTLRFNATQVWLNDATMLPAQCVDVPPHWNHAAGQKIGSAPLDNCYTGWDGLASIRWQSNGHGLLIEADELFRHLIVYTPPSQDFFCLEPVSHMTDAINRMASVPGHGLRVLAPGETVRGSITFRLESAA